MARKPRAVRPAEDDDTPPARLAEPWIEEIDQALKREKPWRDRARKVVERYRDERVSGDRRSKINILWSNTEVLKAALYSRTAKPDIRRRFPDARKGNTASRYAAEALERGLIYCNDLYDIDTPIEDGIEDALLPGRGVVRVEYEPDIVKDKSGERIGEQKLVDRYVYWMDFCHGLARQWCDVPWVAFRHAKRRSEFESEFPDAKRLPKVADYQLEDASGRPLETTEQDKFVEVWEVWTRPTKERLYVARGYRDVLRADDDPLGLAEFFPCPRPLYSVTTNDTLIPEPEYCQYQDQAIELDTVTTRIRVLTEFLKWKGVYDGSVDGENRLADLAAADDGEFLPYQNWAALKDKGGIDAAVGFWPMERIVTVLQQLHVRAPQLIQEIYEITGISDIIRGSTDPRETKGAQQLKAQFGSMRMQRRERDVQRFIRDLYRLKAEIIAEHFTSDNLREITAIDLPTRQELQMQQQQPTGSGLLPAMTQAPAAQPAPAGPSPVAADTPLPGTGAAPASPKPTWDDVMEILRSDRLRSYRVDIETDSTVFEDAQQAKAERIEFMTAMNDMLEKAYLAATNAPMMLPIIKETFMFGIRTFKPGRALEQAAEDAFDQLMTNPPPAPKDDKDAKADDGTAAAKVAIEKQKADADIADKERRFELDKQKAGHEMGMAERQFQLSVAGQNKQIYDEANRQLTEAAQPGEGGGPAPDGMLPIQMMLAGIERLAQTIAEGQAQQGAEIAGLARAVAAPKRVVRGPDGRAVGVEPVTLQ